MVVGSIKDPAALAGQLRNGLSEVQGVMAHLNKVTNYTNPVNWHEIQRRADLPVWADIVEVFGSGNSAWLASQATEGYTGMSWDYLDSKTFLPKATNIPYPWIHPEQTPESVLEGYIFNYYNVLDYLARYKAEHKKLPNRLNLEEIEQLWTPGFIFSWTKETKTPGWLLTLGLTEWKMFQAMMEKLYDTLLEKGVYPSTLELLAKRGQNHRSILSGRLFNLSGTSFRNLPKGKPPKKEESVNIEWVEYYTPEPKERTQPLQGVPMMETPKRMAPSASQEGAIRSGIRDEDVNNFFRNLGADI